MKQYQVGRNRKFSNGAKMPAPPIAAAAAGLLMAGSVVFSGCAMNGTPESGDLDTYGVESAIQSVNSALIEVEQSPSLALNRPVEVKRADLLRKLENILIPEAVAASCGIDRFDPPVGSADCSGTEDDKTVTANFDSCTIGSRERHQLDGTITLSFDSAETCNDWIDALPLPTSGSVTRTSSDFSRLNPNGSTVSKVSDEHENYLGETIGGGVMTQFGINLRQVNILGIHRVRTSPEGDTVFDHSVRTLNPIQVTGTRMENNRRVSNGTIQVDFNRREFSLVTDLSGLFWTSDCCHPTDGSVTFTRSGSRTGSVSVDFGTGTCGEVLITKDDAEAETVELAACE